MRCHRQRASELIHLDTKKLGKIAGISEIEALAGSSPIFAWEQNEPYTIALLIKCRSGGASIKHLYRSGSASTGDHIMLFTSGTTPNLRHQTSGGGTMPHPAQGGLTCRSLAFSRSRMVCRRISPLPCRLCP